MSLHLYNSLTRKLEEFQPLHGKQVGFYACGPTVYWFSHIGNMRAFLFADVLRRALVYNDYNVKFVMNITDVGHLTDDEDAGEDKMIVAMQREGKSAYDIAEFYTQVFMMDLERLNILPADVYPKATNHIAEQIKMIEDIERNGFAYLTSDGVYFDTSKFPSYGVLSGQKAEEKKAGARVEMKQKKHPTDFALWKFSPSTGSGSMGKQGKRDMEWESPWGKGFPGWHIECNAMSTKYLGHPFDLHTGGVDHIAVHHENELAQAVGASGSYHARFWVHNEFLTVDGGKMSKSLGNIYTIDDLVQKGFDPLAFRYFTLGAHYRTKLNFTFDALEAAQNALHRLQDTIRDWDAVPPTPPSPPSGRVGIYEERFFEAIDADLNTPQALALVWELIDDASLPTSSKAASLLRFDEVLGLGLADYVNRPLVIPEDVAELVAEREQARLQKDFSTSDRLRTQIEQKGFLVEDTVNGPKFKQRR